MNTSVQLRKVGGWQVWSVFLRGSLVGNHENEKSAKMQALAIDTGKPRELAAKSALRTAGEGPGHPFHGNQWTSGSGGQEEQWKGGVDPNTTFYRGMSKEGFAKFQVTKTIEANRANVFTTDRETADYYASTQVHDEPGIVVSFKVLPTDIHQVLQDQISKSDFKLKESVRVADYKVLEGHSSLRTAGDLPGHEFHGNQWTGNGGVNVVPRPSAIQDMSVAENKVAMARAVEEYERSSDMRGAADVVTEYASLDQGTGLAVRAIVEMAAQGKSTDQIMANKHVAAQHARQQRDRDDPTGNALVSLLPRERVEQLAAEASGYYASVRDVPSTDVKVYRGASVTPKGDEFELRGPTAFTMDQDVALTYAGKNLFVVKPGAKMLDVKALEHVKRAAEGNEHILLPVMQTPKDRSVHPLGPSHGYHISVSADRELSSAGRFRVVSRTQDRINFEDQKTGNRRWKTVNIITVEQIGVF